MSRQEQTHAQRFMKTLALKRSHPRGVGVNWIRTKPATSVQRTFARPKTSTLHTCPTVIHAYSPPLRRRATRSRTPTHHRERARVCVFVYRARLSRLLINIRRHTPPPRPVFSLVFFRLAQGRTRPPSRRAIERPANSRHTITIPAIGNYTPRPPFPPSTFSLVCVIRRRRRRYPYAELTRRKPRVPGASWSVWPGYFRGITHIRPVTMWQSVNFTIIKILRD